MQEVITTDASVGLHVSRDKWLTLRFFDAQAVQWEESFDVLDDWASDDDLIDEITAEIGHWARDLATSLVVDLRERLAKVKEGS